MEQTRDFYYPDAIGNLPSQFVQAFANEPPFVNIVEENDSENIMLGTKYMYIPPFVLDDSPFAFQDLQVTRGAVTKSIKDPDFRMYFPNVRISDRSLHALPNLIVMAKDEIPIKIDWTWAEIATTQLYSATSSFSLTFYKPDLTEAELEMMAYDKFMMEHIKDFEITNNEFLNATMSADS